MHLNAYVHMLWTYVYSVHIRTRTYVYINPVYIHVHYYVRIYVHCIYAQSGFNIYHKVIKSRTSVCRRQCMQFMILITCTSYWYNACSSNLWTINAHWSKFSPLVQLSNASMSLSSMDSAPLCSDIVITCSVALCMVLVASSVNPCFTFIIPFW